MNALFERYVTVALEEASTKRSSLSVVPQDTHALDLNRQVLVKPDVVVYCDDTPGLALDAKYKCEDPNTDIYQALAYCHALGLRRTVLAYPASEGIAALRHRIRPDAGSEVVLLPFNLSGDIADLRRQTEAFAESVWREVAH
jgi:5-methylcytosine-specific restriction enzyme subunit McrC